MRKNNRERKGKREREKVRGTRTTKLQSHVSPASTFLSFIHISVDPPRANFLFHAPSSKIVSPLKYSPWGARTNPSFCRPHPLVFFFSLPRHDRGVLQGSALRASTSVPGSRGTMAMKSGRRRLQSSESVM